MNTLKNKISGQHGLPNKILHMSSVGMPSRVTNPQARTLPFTHIVVVIYTCTRTQTQYLIVRNQQSQKLLSKTT